MTHQSEQQLENNLIAQLGGLNFAPVTIKDTNELEANLKTQLEKLNGVEFSDREFRSIRNELYKGTIFDKSKLLRDRITLHRDDDSVLNVVLFDGGDVSRNTYQVSNQITQVGKYENRYDVTLLVNGLPLVQIELKRRGVEMKEAFNQVKRYHKHSFVGTLFEFVQVFVISNGVNTKYFANNPKQSFEQTFYWTDEQNQKVTTLEDFASIFFDRDFLTKFIGEYIVLADGAKIPMVLRPYQYYAVRAIETRVRETEENGYIWHTTGSGKTLTSFKTAKVLTDLPDVKKVLFVVDRRDLDMQTVEEYNTFESGVVDATPNTARLVKRITDPNKKLIVTTVQKIDRALKSQHFAQDVATLKDQKIVIIFDECHRGHFGDTHQRIKQYFTRAQMFGFTGTPIFADNAQGTGANKKTTRDLFDEVLHKYTITDAIDDNNVLGFAVEYVGRYKQKDANTVDADIEVPAIDEKEIFEDDERVEKIVKYILQDHGRKTKNKKYNAMLAVSSVEMLKKYYLILKELAPENFNIATIFSYQANEEDKQDGSLDVDEEGAIENQHSREFLDYCIDDYNTLCGTNFSSSDFEGYRKDLQKRLKDKKGKYAIDGTRIDLVIVVNMMLTGFDALKLNTLYVDKNLKYHGLIQAYSRTNRILNADKPHGNVVVFRNLKEDTDKALALYGNPDANEIVFIKPYEEMKKKMEVAIDDLLGFVGTVDAVDNLHGEEDKKAFITYFRDLLRVKASAETYAEFMWSDFRLDEQNFEDFKSKYLDLYAEIKMDRVEKESVAEEIDFELELVVRDEIDYDYIITLISDIASETDAHKRAEKVRNFLQKIQNNIRYRCTFKEIMRHQSPDKTPQQE